MNENHKRVAVLYCPTKLKFVKAIKDVTKKSLLESKQIADTLIIPHFGGETEYGTLLLNESSITVQQWEEIVKQPDLEIKWEYV